MNLKSSLSFSSQTPLQKQQTRKSRTIIQLLIDNIDSTQFRQPVDWQSLGLVDYLQIIDYPMDLSTVNRKLQGEEYGLVEDIIDDVQLIWDNCKKYNLSGSWIYSTADKMEKYFKKLIKNYFSQVTFAQNNKILLADPPQVARSSRTSLREKDNTNFCKDQQPNGNQKIKFIDRLKKLTPENLGKIVEIILQNSPEACQYLQQDHCQINIQKLHTQILEQIQDKMREWKETEDKLSKRIKI